MDPVGNYSNNIHGICGSVPADISWHGIVVNNIIVCLVNIVFGILGVFLNGLVILILWRSPKTKRSMTYFFIMILSALDFTTLVIVQPLFLHAIIQEFQKGLNCRLLNAYRVTGGTLVGLSAVTLSVMNMERYLSILYPLFHRKMMNKTKWIVILAFVWCVVLGYSVSRSLSPESRTLTAVVAGFCAVMFLQSFFVYVSIFVVARKSFLERNSVGIYDQEVTRAQQINFLRGLKMAKTYLLIVLLAFLAYVPSIATFTVQTLMPDDADYMKYLNLMKAKHWTDTLVFINSTLNCLVFFWGNKELNKEGWKFLKYWLKR